MLEEYKSTYKDDAGRCSEACPARVALRAVPVYTSRQSSTTEPLGLLYLTALHHSSQPSENKPFFPNVAARTEHKLAI